MHAEHGNRDDGQGEGRTTGVLTGVGEQGASRRISGRSGGGRGWSDEVVAPARRAPSGGGVGAEPEFQIGNGVAQTGVGGLARGRGEVATPRWRGAGSGLAAVVGASGGGRRRPIQIGIGRRRGREGNVQGEWGIEWG